MAQAMEEVIAAVQMATECIVEAARVAGPAGAPSGLVFAGLQAHGMRLATYQSLLEALERHGKIVVSGHLIRLPAQSQEA